jgi:thiosulfate reductase cytochrome b subunit
MAGPPLTGDRDGAGGEEPPTRPAPIHPAIVRLTHWVNAGAIVMMMLSGWQIYDASPLFPFRFPPWMTLGGWLGGALAWHFAAMWLFVVNGLGYLAYGVLSGHLRRSLLPVTLRTVLGDLGKALTGRLVHQLGVYNAVQRLLYLVVIAAEITAVASGLALWKPVQLHALASLLGGYEAARRVHFAAMATIAGFIAIHVIMVAVVPATLPPMFIGRWRSAASKLGEGSPS